MFSAITKNGHRRGCRETTSIGKKGNFRVLYFRYSGDSVCFRQMHFYNLFNYAESTT